MKIKSIINEVIVEVNSNSDIWYHGTPDERDVKSSGFVEKFGTTDYVSDPGKWNELQ